MSRRFNLIIFSFTILLSCSGTKKINIVSDNGSIEKAKTERSAFLREATFYGLQKDQFPVEIANALVEESAIWVVKCPICDHVKRGFKMYIKKNEELNKTKLSDDFIWRIIDQNVEVKKTALKELVDRYVQQYYSVINMTKSERQVMQISLEEGRKDGMNVASGGEGFFCASCDGACHIKE